MTDTIQSYLCGQWRSGDENGRFTVVNPATNEVIGAGSTSGLDLAAAFEHARDVGVPALRAMTFAERGALLGAISKNIQAAREALIETAIQNGGNTRGDAKFDIDGATGTLYTYSKIGAEIGDQRWIVDGDRIDIGRTGRWCGQHLLVPRDGVAVHINAYNFPAWGMCEKLAVALLAGMPVITKPAPSTAPLAVDIVRNIIDAGILPEGALQLLSGPPNDLLDHVGPQDVIAFTGSNATAQRLRTHPAVVANNTHLNVEADSVNAAVLAPDVEEGDDTYHLFIRDLAREITQKAGQKCTATRRVFVPAERIDVVQEALAAALEATVVGDPTAENVRMGPLNDRAALARVLEGIAALEAEGARRVSGAGVDLEPVGGTSEGAFISPILMRQDAPKESVAAHQTEVFGPIATLMPYSGEASEAVDLVNRGGGGLVASIYSDDPTFVEVAVLGVAPHHGRVYVGDKRCAAQSWGTGAVLPTLNHGGPGRAGGGAELGGVIGLHAYLQRVALQGSRRIVTRTFGER